MLSLEVGLDDLEFPFSTLELSPPYDLRFDPDDPFEIPLEDESIVRLEVES